MVDFMDSIEQDMRRWNMAQSWAGLGFADNSITYDLLTPLLAQVLIALES